MAMLDKNVTAETPEKWTETPNRRPPRPISLSAGGEKSGETGIPVNACAARLTTPVNVRDGAERTETGGETEACR